MLSTIETAVTCCLRGVISGIMASFSKAQFPDSTTVNLVESENNNTLGSSVIFGNIRCKSRSSAI